MKVCNAVDGLPLATELAAARMRTLPVDQLAARLGERLPMLAGGARTAPERQRTVEGAVRWSYDLLSEPEKTLFRRLAVFSGGWTLEAAEGICAFGDLKETDVFALLESLADRSLVVASPESDGRFRFLEVILEFTRNELEACGEAESVGRRHCRWFRELAESAEPHLETWSVPYWLELLECDLDNLRAALAWASGFPLSLPDGLVICGALRIFWNHRGHLGEAYEASRRLLRHGTSAPAGARLTATQILAWGAIFKLEMDVALDATDAGEELARELGDDEMLARFLSWRAYVLQNIDDPAAARDAAERGAAAAVRAGSRGAEARR